MRGLSIQDGKVHLRDDLLTPAPAPGEALIQVHLAGICATDIEILRGYTSFEGIPGHEFVGTVVQAEDPRWIGRRVVGEINVACGACDMCRRGLKTHCRRRAVLGIRGRDGVMAEYLALPLENLHAVPDHIPDDVAVFCEPLAAALQMLETFPVHPSDLVLVLGDGKLGFLSAQVLQLAGAQVIVLGHHSENLRLFEELGISASSDDEAYLGRADVVVECTGRPAGFARALELVRPRGAILLKSTYAGEHPLNLSDIAVKEIQVVGSRCGPFPPALRLLARGAVHVRPFIEHIYPLEEGEAAFTHASRAGARKILIALG